MSVKKTKYVGLALILYLISITALSAPVSASAPGYLETSEYLIGDVKVEVIFLESNGTLDPNTEDWTSAEETKVMSEIIDGLTWLANQNPDAGVNFWISAQYKVPTSFEPITRTAKNDGDEGAWISEAMTYLGYPSTPDTYRTQVQQYVNDLRDDYGTDWAFTIFVVDSSNDFDGLFKDAGYTAYAYRGGPFLVLTYDSGKWPFGVGINNMDFITVHETLHIFWATDEYDFEIQYSGYLNAPDNLIKLDGIMGIQLFPLFPLPWNICPETREQIGWRDTDGDGVQDIVDTFPETTLIPYSPDPTYDRILTFSGTARVIPYHNQNPAQWNSGNDVSINTITGVYYQIDNGVWNPATPLDGAFDEAEEQFTFTTPEIWGIRTIRVRAENSVGNWEQVGAVDTVTIYLGDIFPGDEIGRVKTTFGTFEDVYVTGGGYIPNTEVTIYIIPDGYDATPSNAKATTRKTVSGGGSIGATLVWSHPLDFGEYDIWVDVDQNGVFDDGDVLKNQAFGIFALNVIPEVPFGVIMSSISMFMALLGFVGLKRFHQRIRA